MVLGILDLVILNLWVAPAVFSPSVHSTGEDLVAQAGGNPARDNALITAKTTATPKSINSAGQKESHGTASRLDPSAATPPKDPSVALVESQPEEPPKPQDTVRPEPPAVEKQAAAPPEPPKPPKPSLPPIPKKSVVYFETSQYVLSQQAKQKLTSIVRLLADAPGLKITLKGHADSRGDGVYNQRLSLMRAGVVEAFFLAKKVSAKFVSQGLGDRFPVGSGTDTQTLALNRRVEILISQGDK